jgi:hypothetical protein
MNNIVQENGDVGGRRLGLDRRVSNDSNFTGIERRISGDRRNGTRKRTHRRLRAKEGAFAVIPSSYIIGPIYDVSKGGLSFILGVAAEIEHISSEMDMFSGDGFQIKKIPCQIVNSIQMDDQASFNQNHPMRCCIQFGAIEDDQSSKLNYFMESYTEI